MQIYLMRHALAEEPHVWAGPDKTRPLTDAGILALETALPHMKRLKVSADVLLSSPYERASQTGDLVGQELHILQTLQCPELAAGARPEALERLIARHADSSSLWFVVHMPEICIFASRLAGDPAMLEHNFSPGEIVSIECPIQNGVAGEGRTRWRRRLEDWARA